ncbi:extensin-like domain-containing protein, partial [Roseicyclus sp.]|uniref:extensin-like domain-containing protein n=1 Tax=Roseicyclus sp. TaxID=1914329 RepID=UPI003F9F8DEF
RPAAIARIASGGAAAVSPRPAARPERLEQETRAAAARLTPGRVAQPGVRGTLCGLPGLVGDRLEPITGRVSGCGIAEPVRLREVDGIPLTTPATINCDTARALQTWVRQGLVPAVGRTGGGVANLRVVASYACRARNSQTGARLSEHARGNAIDIAGIGLADGSELTVLTDWRNGQEGRILRQLHQAACGPFGTVLGPNSDRFHQDHFHFDVASHRSGSYCR